MQSVPWTAHFLLTLLQASITETEKIYVALMKSIPAECWQDGVGVGDLLWGSTSDWHFESAHQFLAVAFKAELRMSM
jgi:hypothetical protein